MSDESVSLDPIVYRERLVKGRSFVRADGTRETTITHQARWNLADGVIPDLTKEYGSWKFRPRRLSVTWENEELREITLTGPRVLKDRLSDRETASTSAFKWGRVQFVLPREVNAVINAYAEANPIGRWFE